MNLLLLKEGQTPLQGLPLLSHFNTSSQPSLVNWSFFVRFSNVEGQSSTNKYYLVWGMHNFLNCNVRWDHHFTSASLDSSSLVLLLVRGELEFVFSHEWGCFTRQCFGNICRYTWTVPFLFIYVFLINLGATSTDCRCC
jgi:hypothetical protein